MINFDKLVKRIKKSSNIFIMGHKGIDFDALGACLAVNQICENFNKKNYIIIDDNKFDGGIRKAFDYINNSIKVKIGKYNDFKDKIKKDSLLIIVDTYNENRSQSPKLCQDIKNIIFIDHHLFGKPANDNYYIDSKVSSVSEMLSNIFVKKRIKLDKCVATVMVAGIDIDSNSYSIKTTNKTHEAVAFLLKKGAELPVAIDFTRTKIEEYIKIQKIIFKTEFYKKKFAFVLCEKTKEYETKSLAMIAETLLKFTGVDASFAIGFLDKDLVGISARSINYNVEELMKKLGGGGSKNNAACQIASKSLKATELLIKGELQCK